MYADDVMEKFATLRNAWKNFVGVDCLDVNPKDASSYWINSGAALSSMLEILKEGNKSEKEWTMVKKSFEFVMELLVAEGVMTVNHSNSPVSYIMINGIVHPKMLAFVPYVFAKEDDAFFKKKYKIWLYKRYIGTIEYGDKIEYSDLDPEFLSVGYGFKFYASHGYAIKFDTYPKPDRKVVVLGTDAFDGWDYTNLSWKLDSPNSGYELLTNITIKEEHKKESSFAKGLPGYQSRQLAKADLVYVADYTEPEFWESLIRRYNDHAEIMFPKESRKIEILTLCGSMRFKNNILNIKTELESYGFMVLIPNMGVNPDQMDDELIRKLHIAHYRKMDQSNYVIIVNRDGYIGDDTQREIDYCYLNNIPVIYAYDYNTEEKTWEMILSKEMLSLH